MYCCMFLIPSPHRNKTSQTHISSHRDKQSSEDQYNMLEIKTTNAQPRFLHYLTNVFIRTEVNWYYRKMMEKVKKSKQNDGSGVKSDFWTGHTDTEPVPPHGKCSVSSDTVPFRLLLLLTVK